MLCDLTFHFAVNAIEFGPSTLTKANARKEMESHQAFVGFEEFMSADTRKLKGASAFALAPFDVGSSMKISMGV